MFSAGDRTNPNAEMAVKAMGHSPAGLFGFSHMQRRPGRVSARADGRRRADQGADSVSDEQALFPSDVPEFRDNEDGVIKVLLRPGG